LTIKCLELIRICTSQHFYASLIYNPYSIVKEA
jgi:hypothetical protein